MPDTNVVARIVRRAQGSLARITLSSTARTVLRENLTYLSPVKIKRLENLVDDVLSRKVEGDLVEFGVALGGSAILLAKKALPSGRSFQGFDLFGMIPSPTSDHDDAKSRERYEIIASGKSEGLGGDTYYGYRPSLYSEVCAAFARHGVPVNGKSIVLTKGLFEDTLVKSDISRIAFAHIDCDWYDPVKLCLNWVSTRLMPGGTILLDDYHDYGGCRKATDEFIKQNPRFELRDAPTMALSCNS